MRAAVSPVSVAKWEAIDWTADDVPDDADTAEGRLQWASGLCLCGADWHGKAGLIRLLEAHASDDPGRFDAVLPDPELQVAMLWLVDAAGFSEHGGSVGGAWLSERGKQVLELLREVQAE